MTAADTIVLPVNVKPTRYEIWLQPNFTDFSFAGEETIEVEVVEPTSQIQLNSVEINIRSATLTQGGNSSLLPGAWLWDGLDVLTLSPDTGHPNGGTALTIAEAGHSSKPCLVLDLLSREAGPDTVEEWLAGIRPERLNVAGPRESEAPGVYARTRALLARVWGEATSVSEPRQ